MFVGKEKDSESGLYYFGARYKDPTTGRFISPDIVNAVDPQTRKINQKALMNPQRLNRYAYAANNPYKFVDPDGLDWYYAQETGHLVYFNVQTQLYIDFGAGVAASGSGQGLNNSTMQDVPMQGPIPEGVYTMGELISYTFNSGTHKGESTPAIILDAQDNATKARLKEFNRSGLLIHHFLSACNCTNGCIGTSDNLLQTIGAIINSTGDKTLHVQDFLSEDFMNNHVLPGSIGWSFPNY